MAQKLEACLFPGADVPIETTRQCFAEDAKAQWVDAVPAVEASGRDAVAALQHSWFGLDLSERRSTVALTVLKGFEAAFVVHLQGRTGEANATSGNAPGTTGGNALGVTGGLLVKYNKRDEIAELRVYLDQLSVLGQERGGAFPHRPVAEAPQEHVRALATGFTSEGINGQLMLPFLGDSNEHNARFISRYYADDATLVRSWRPVDITGKLDIRASYAEEYKRSRDVRHIQLRSWSAQDFFVLQAQRSGTSTAADFGAQAASNGKYTLHELHIFRIDGRTVAEHWVFANGLSLATQSDIAFPGADAIKR